MTLVAAAAACSTRAPEPAATPAAPDAAGARAHTYLLERVDDAAVVQLYADGFDALPLQREDARSGISTRRRSPAATSTTTSATRTASRCASVLEEILTHPHGVDAGHARRDPALHEAVLAQHRPVQQPDGAQVRAEVHARGVRRGGAGGRGGRRAVPAASRRDARRDARRGSSRCSSTRASTRSSRTRRPGAGKDILRVEREQPVRRRHDGRPRGVRRAVPAELAPGEARRQAGRGGLPGRRPLRRRRSRAIVEAPRGGACRSPPSRWRRRSRALVTFYRTGETADREAYDIAWVQDKASPVDTINGFIEVYLDARGIKGAWEALVFYVNQEKTDGHPEARRATRSGSRTACRGTRSTASRACRASRPTPSTSSSRPATPGPVTPVGINLPNDQRDPRAVRQQVGVAVERQRGVRQVDAAGLPRASSRGRRRRPRAPTKWSAFAGELTTNMHEVIGHGSGKRGRAAEGQPAGGAQGAVLGARGGARRPGRRSTSCPTRSWSSSASCRRTTSDGDRAGRVRGLHAQRARAAAPRSARARRSRKTTCATAR